MNSQVVPCSVPVWRLTWLARAALLTAACFTHSSRVRPADSPSQEKPRPAEVNKIELYRLTNEELFKRGNAIWEKVSRDYLTQTRALATAEAQLEDVRKQTDMVKNVEALPADDPVKKAVDAAKAKQDVVNRRLKLIQTQKEVLDRITTRIEECRSTTVAFQNALDDLKAYAFEGDLRFKDGSLAQDKIPSELTPEFLEKKRGELLAELARLKSKTADVQKEQEALTKVLDEAKKVALTADADVVEASKNLAREQQRQQLEKAYVGKETDEMIAELERMVDEGIALKGAYELVLRRFDARVTTAARLRSDLDALKPPVAKVPQLVRAEDVETAARSIQELIRFYAGRARKVEELQTALTALAREGGEFEADATVSEEHLFKMQMLTNLLKKKGVEDAKLPERVRSGMLDSAVARQKESASTVRATTEKAKTELPVLERQLAEARSAGEAVAKQLANLKESQDVTLAALQWEGKLKGMSAAEVIASFTAARKELGDRLEKLKGEAASYSKATAAVTQATARLDGLKDPFIRAAEEQGQTEKQKLIGELRKEAGLERAAPEAAPSAPTVEPKKVATPANPVADTRTELDKATEQLSAFQQLLAGRVRVLDEREVKKKELCAALDELEKAATSYSNSLSGARLFALQLSATAMDLKKRLGKGDLGGDAIPEGITEALQLETRTQLDANTTAVLNALNRLQQDREKLLRPDPEGEGMTTALKELLTMVGQRLDLLAEQKRLDADYRRERSARPTIEQKRLERLALERRSEEASRWDRIMGIDSSKAAKDLSELLDTYYRELIEIEEKEENLRKQREKADQLIELTQKESSALARLRPLLAKQITQFEAAREEESLIAHIRLRPDQADELLKAYQTKTGRLIPKPLPIPDKEKAEKVDALGSLLFDRYVLVEAAKRWDDVLGARAGPTGITAEAGVYQDELTKLNAASAGNLRRIETLTGAAESRPAAGGEIAKTHRELSTVRSRGMLSAGIKIGCVVLGVFLIPKLLMAILRRATWAQGAENTSLVFSALRALVKTITFIVGFAIILHTLGIDVTAIIAGLGIGGLAIGLAAQPLIADAIAAVVIVAERRFKIGDVIRLGGNEPGRVIGLSWRSTQVRSSDGLVMTFPNRRVMDATTHNLTRVSGTYDSLTVSITTQKEVSQVLAAVESAMMTCEQLGSDRGVTMKAFTQQGDTKTISYRFWWFLKDYDSRSKTRDEVFARITTRLTQADMAGTEISMT